MLNLLAIVAVFLSVAQASVPATGKASSNPAEYHQTPKYPADRGEGQPTAKVASPDAAHGPTFEGDGENKRYGDNDSTINITNPASVSVPWPWHDIVAWIANLLLVGVAVGGVVVAICTLRRIERQTIATEIAARSAMKSAEIAANAGRAWIVPEVRFNSRLHDYAKQGLPEISCMIVIMKNFGASPAEVSKAQIMALLSPFELPSEPVYDDMEVAAIAGEVIAPNGHAIATVRIRHEKMLTPEQMKEVAMREKKLVCYGRIEYTDNSGRKRVTQFGHEWYARTGPDDDRPEAMYRAFGREYNFTL